MDGRRRGGEKGVGKGGMEQVEGCGKRGREGRRKMNWRRARRGRRRNDRMKVEGRRGGHIAY